MPKNIVLLSDGTGNSASTATRTNVWRLYRSLDLQDPKTKQIAFYDDGVGSQQFVPLKILGGALGLGLKRNVIELFEFLCRNYQPGDRVYLFGFSRGAFTVRTLAGLIHGQGLVTDFGDERDLHKKAQEKYRAFRKKFSRGLGRKIYQKDDSEWEPSPAAPGAPPIEFIGVWDTVDAYGLPIDEMSQAWDYFITPLRFPDYKLASSVKKACHAVALDDERLTFHPVMWDESSERKLEDGWPLKGGETLKVDSGRIEQVWFAGAHANVGGGYPKDELALVTLDWMMSKSEARGDQSGLHFIASERDRIADQANQHGTLYDSRRGLGAYYRYKPRNMADICHDKVNGVFIDKPKVHESVLVRIHDDVVPYAPLGIPANYAVQPRDPQCGTDIKDKYECDALPQKRVTALNHAWDVVYGRRYLYVLILAATAILVASKFFLDWTPQGPCEGPLCFADPVINLIIKVTPDFAAGWLEALRQNPNWMFGFLAVFGALFGLKRHAFFTTQKHALAAWAHVKKDGAGKVPPEWKESLAYSFRNLFGPSYKRFVNLVGAFFAFILIAFLLFFVLSRMVFEVRTTLGETCEESAELSPPPAEGVSLPFDAALPCVATGIRLEKGQSYSFEVTAASVNWDDSKGDYPWLDGAFEAGPDGFKSAWSTALLAPWVPTRRSWSQPWFKLMARISDTGKDRYALGKGPITITARTSGEVFFFVNDAICGFCPGATWSLPYRWPWGRNQGTAQIKVTPVQKPD